jgi:hypothetical protein
MGPFVNSPITQTAAVAAAAVVLLLNFLLVAQTFHVTIPGLPA